MSSYQGVTPVEFKVLVRPDKVEDRSAGGLYLPDSSRDRQQYAMDRGVILAYGDGFWGELPPPKPKVGDKVIFDKYAGAVVDIQIDGNRETCRLINDKHICAILEE
jgi:chaperonin GroES